MISLTVLVEQAMAAQVEARLQRFLWSTTQVAPVDDRLTRLVVRRRVATLAVATPDALDSVFQDVVADLGALSEAVEAMGIETASHRPRWWSAAYVDAAGESFTAAGPVQQAPPGPVAVYHRRATPQATTWCEEFLAAHRRVGAAARHTAYPRSRRSRPAIALLLLGPVLVLVLLRWAHLTGPVVLVLTLLLALLLRVGLACRFLTQTDLCRPARARGLRAARRSEVVQWARASWTGKPSRWDPPAVAARIEKSPAMVVQRAIPAALVVAIVGYAVIAPWPWLPSRRSTGSGGSSSPPPDARGWLYLTLAILGVFAMAWLFVSVVDRRFPSIARRALGRATAGVGLVAFLGTLRWWLFASGAHVPVLEVDAPRLGVVWGGVALTGALVVLVGSGAYLVAYMPSGIGRASAVLVCASLLLLVSVTVAEADYLAGYQTRYGLGRHPRLMPGGACWTLEQPLRLSGGVVVPRVLEVADQSGRTWVRYPGDGQWQVGRDEWQLARVSSSSITGQPTACPEARAG